MSGLSVAVVVPVFERPRAVLEALESVASQTRRPDALVVVDDGSNDDTPERIAQWIGARGGALGARLVRRPHAGVSATRNHGAASVAHADVLAFLDSDDRWVESYLEAHLEVLSGDPAAVASTSDKNSLDVPTGRRRRVDRSWVERDCPLEIARRGPPGISNTVIRAEAFRRVGGFSERLDTAEDLDLMLRLSLLGRWRHVPATEVEYRHRLGETWGEAPSLGHEHEDRRRTRAQVLEDFASEVASTRPDLVSPLQRLTAAQWERAGRQLMRAGRRREALPCFERSLALRPMAWRARAAAWRLRLQRNP